MDMSRRRSRRKKWKSGVGIIAFVVLILFAIVSYSRIDLEKRYKEAEIQINRLEAKISEQMDRQSEINNLKAYVQTKSYIEEIAREKLGLVYEDELIFKRDDKSKNKN